MIYQEVQQTSHIALNCHYRNKSRKLTFGDILGDIWSDSTCFQMEHSLLLWTKGICTVAVTSFIDDPDFCKMQAKRLLAVLSRVSSENWCSRKGQPGSSYYAWCDLNDLALERSYNLYSTSSKEFSEEWMKSSKKITGWRSIVALLHRLPRTAKFP